MFLLQAVNQNNVERVRTLLATKSCDVNVKDNHHFTGNFLYKMIQLVDF